MPIEVNETKRTDGTRNPNVLVTGPARSGTTLMHLLMYFGFEDTELLYPERHISSKNIWVHSDALFLVYKNIMDAKSIEDIFNELDPVSLIFMVRDPRDLVTSKNFTHSWKYVQKTNDVHSILGNIMSLQEDVLDRINVVKFEDLVEDPDGVQRDIAEKSGLKACRCFSECYRHFDEIQESAYVGYTRNLVSREGGSKFRPFDDDGIGRWSAPEHEEWFRLCMHQSGRMQNMLEHFGYEKDDTWWEEYKKST